MRAGETEQQMAVRHVAEQEKRIAQQEALIERLRKVGAPSDDALGLLATIKNDARSCRAAFKLGYCRDLRAVIKRPCHGHKNGGCVSRFPQRAGKHRDDPPQWPHAAWKALPLL